VHADRYEFQYDCRWNRRYCERDTFLDRHIHRPGSDERARLYSKRERLHSFRQQWNDHYGRSSSFIPGILAVL
jgi:hypothetical protein